MLKGIKIENFTNFRQSKIEFAENVNIIFGDSGLGKSNILKLIHAFVGSKSSAVELDSEIDVSDILKYRFDVKGLLDLINYNALHVSKNYVKFTFENSEFNSGFTIINNVSSKELKEIESIYNINNVVLIPDIDLLRANGLINFYDNNSNLTDKVIKHTHFNISNKKDDVSLNSELEQVTIELDREVGGSIVEKSDRKLYLKTTSSSHLKIEQLAAGKRKLALLSLLIKNGHISKNSILLMDDIDSSLDYRQQRLMVKVINTLAMNNIQVFLVAKSYFFIKECEINFRKSGIDTQYINLFGNNHTEVEQSEALDGIQNMSTLDEELAQYDREQDLYK